MFIRLEKVPAYERHLLFCSDLDERLTPNEFLLALPASPPEANGRTPPTACDESPAAPPTMSPKRRPN